MPAEEHRLFTELGGLKSEVRALSERFDALESATRNEHRTVHDIVVATSEAVRILTRIVDEMKPLVDDYREKRAEERGREQVKKGLYALWAGVGGLVVFAIGKIWEVIFYRGGHP